MDPLSSPDPSPRSPSATERETPLIDQHTRKQIPARWSWIVLSASTALAWLAVFLYRGPTPPGVESPANQFSAVRALRHVEAVARAPHPTGSTALAEVHAYLLTELRKLGLQPTEQLATISPRKNDLPISINNILARKPGTNNTRALMLCAHYDSVSRAPGAGDNGAAVAALLETLRALNSAPPLRNDVIILFTDGEELGLLGARAFALEHPWLTDIGMVCNFDARGTSGPSIMFETSPDNRQMIREFARAVHYPIATSLSGFVYQHMPNGTDFTVFKRAGLAGLNFAFIEAAQNYHQPTDTPGNLDPRTLQHTGEQMVSLAHHFGTIDLPLEKAGDAIYFNVLGPLFVSYAKRWVLPLSGVLIATMLAILSLILKDGDLAWRRIGVGFVWVIGSSIVSALTGWAVFKLTVKLTHAMPGILALSVTGVLVALIVALLYHVVARRTPAPLESMIAGLIAWTTLAVTVAFLVPEGSYLFFWPALWGWILFGLSKALRPYVPASYVVSVVPLIAFALLTPISFLLWTALPPALPFLAVLLAFSLVLLIPLLDGFFPRSRVPQ